MQRRTFLSYGATGVAVIGATLFAGWLQVDGPGAPEVIATRPLPLSEMAFQMTDHEGNTVGPEKLSGRASLIFFGFTYCPDVCPTPLSDISGRLEALGGEAENLNVVSSLWNRIVIRSRRWRSMSAFVTPPCVVGRVRIDTSRAQLAGFALPMPKYRPTMATTRTAPLASFFSMPAAVS